MKRGKILYGLSFLISSQIYILKDIHNDTWLDSSFK